MRSLVGTVGGLPLALVALCGCGPESLIEVSIDADFVIPAETDELRTTVTDAQSGDLISDDAFTLTQDQSFPIVILYEPKAELSRELRHRAAVSLAGSEVAATAVEYTWQQGKLNEVTITLTP